MAGVAGNESHESLGGERSRLSPMDVAKRVYAIHGDVTLEAIADFTSRLVSECLEEEAYALLGRILLDQIRRSQNQPIYQRAKALKDRFDVEAPPNGYRRPTDTVSSLDEVMTGDDQGKGYLGRQKVSALRAFINVKIRLNKRVIRAASLRKDEMLQYAEQLEKQGRGCIQNAELMRDLWAVTRPGETGRTAVHRLEREAAI